MGTSEGAAGTDLTAWQGWADRTRSPLWCEAPSKPWHLSQRKLKEGEERKTREQVLVGRGSGRERGTENGPCSLLQPLQGDPSGLQSALQEKQNQALERQGGGTQRLPDTRFCSVVTHYRRFQPLLSGSVEFRASSGIFQKGQQALFRSVAVQPLTCLISPHPHNPVKCD